MRRAPFPLQLLPAILAAAAAGPLACGGAVPARPANLVLIVFDTTRSDHLSAYGYPRETSPNLAALAAQGVRVERAYAPSATTAPSHASLFTSLYPLAHGVVKNGLPLAEEHLTLAERLALRGYQTAAFVSSFVLDARFGFAQGFEVYDDDFPERPGRPLVWEGHELGREFDRPADATTARAIRWLLEERDPRRPFLLFVHYFDPHDPYEPPQRHRARLAPEPGALPLAREVAHYDAEIAFADAELGALVEVLDRLGLAEQTLLALTADHGEGLRDHGHMFHGIQIYEEAVRVPLLLRWPGRLPAGRVLGGPVELVDLVPTALELLAVAHDPASLHGRSLAAQLREGDAGDPERPVFLHRRHYAERAGRGTATAAGEKFGIVLGRWKYIVGEAEGSEELFDLERDPGERENRLAAEPRVAARLAARLRRWHAAHAPADPAPPELAPEVREALRALGYEE